MPGIFILLVSLILSAAIASTLGEKRKIGFGWSLFFCIILSPIIGLIITLLSAKKPDNKEPITKQTS